MCSLPLLTNYNKKKNIIIKKDFLLFPVDQFFQRLFTQHLFQYFTGIVPGQLVTENEFLGNFISGNPG